MTENDKTLTPAEAQLAKVNAIIEALDPVSQSIVTGTCAAIEMACANTERNLAMLALNRITCEAVVAMQGPKKPRLVVVGA